MQKNISSAILKTVPSGSRPAYIKPAGPVSKTASDAPTQVIWSAEGGMLLQLLGTRWPLIRNRDKGRKSEKTE